jgi:hypothetical protein
MTSAQRRRQERLIHASILRPIIPPLAILMVLILVASPPRGVQAQIGSPSQPLPSAGLRLLPHQDQYINRFGSKFGIQFYPHHVGLLPAGLGPRHNHSSLTDGVYSHALLAISIGGRRYVLPLISSRSLKPGDQRITQFTLRREMTSATLTSSQFPAEIDVKWKFISPFYPRAIKLSTAPFFYVLCRIKNRGTLPQTVSVIGGLPAGPTTTVSHHSDEVLRTTHIHVIFRGPETVKLPKTLTDTIAIAAAESTDKFTTIHADHCIGISRTIVVKPGATDTVGLILAQYVHTRNVVSYFGRPCAYEYQRLFPSVQAVMDYARTRHKSIVHRSSIFNNIVSGAAIPADIKAFIARNFQVYLGATWMLSRPGGKRLFTSYEGGTGYFSTIDVEFNLAPFYAMFCPSCLKSELNLWATCYYHWPNLAPYRTGPGGSLIRFGPKYGIMEHDVGGGFIINRQVYLLGAMPVEENSNYILLNSLYWRYTGSLKVFRRHERLCLTLANYILHSSTDVTGLPDQGTRNTLDGFGGIHRSYADQVFLGLKAACALQALSDMLTAAGEPHLAIRYRRRAKLIAHSIETQAWLGNHYAITISPRHPPGWNAPWALTTNGILYDLLTAQDEPLMVSRVHKDLENQIDHYTKWPSMGIWRDMIACYFGIHPQTRYDFRPDFFGDQYPRSFDSIAMIQTWAGIGVNVPGRQITIAPDAKGWFPLPALANWKKEQIPWICVHNGKIELKNGRLLRRFRIKLARPAQWSGS